jgi:hypothetical protein
MYSLMYFERSGVRKVLLTYPLSPNEARGATSSRGVQRAEDGAVYVQAGAVAAGIARGADQKLVQPVAVEVRGAGERRAHLAILPVAGQVDIRGQVDGLAAEEDEGAPAIGHRGAVVGGAHREVVDAVAVEVEPAGEAVPEIGHALGPGQHYVRRPVHRFAPEIGVRRAGIGAGAAVEVGPDEKVARAVAVDVARGGDRNSEVLPGAVPLDEQVGGVVHGRPAVQPVHRPARAAASVAPGRAQRDVRPPVAVEVAGAGHRCPRVLHALGPEDDHVRPGVQARAAAEQADRPAVHRPRGVVRLADQKVVVPVAVEVPGARHGEAELPVVLGAQDGQVRGGVHLGPPRKRYAAPA